MAMAHTNRGIRLFGCAAAVLASMACGSGESGPEAAASSAAPAALETSPPERVERAVAAPAAARSRIVVLGDSLTAGLGLPTGEAYPTLLQQRLDAEGLPFEIVNAGVSGDTSAGGLRRLEWVLDGEVSVLVVALGGNDALRGLPTEELQRNLSRIVEGARARGIDVVLAGMEAPRNFGPAYTGAFHRVYPDLAGTYGVALVPFLLEGVAGIPSMNQPDGIHPSAEGARKVADNVWTVLEPVVRRRATRSNT
jgi:acyl-CoA thioesterase-1